MNLIWDNLINFNLPGLEMNVLKSVIGLEITFGTTKQNRKPQYPSLLKLVLPTSTRYQCKICVERLVGRLAQSQKNSSDLGLFAANNNWYRFDEDSILKSFTALIYWNCWHYPPHALTKPLLYYYRIQNPNSDSPNRIWTATGYRSQE